MDDNPADVDLIIDACEQAEVAFEISIVMDGELALDFLHRREIYRDAHVPHAIVLDLNLPKLTGVEVLAEMRRHAHLSAIPVVVLTSSERDCEIQRLADYGARHVRKSLEANAFIPLLLAAIADGLSESAANTK